MLGENIDSSKANEELVENLAVALCDDFKGPSPLVVAICGESGSGKSVLAKALGESLDELGLSTYILQMDDYFFLPPGPTSELRQVSLENVGPREVDLALLDKHAELITLGSRNFELREMHFKENYLRMKPNDIPSHLDFLLVDGTYTSMLVNVHKRVFLKRTFHQTHVHRVARMREPHSELIEQVLEIEHGIVKQFLKDADYIVTEQFELRPVLRPE